MSRTESVPVDRFDAATLALHQAAGVIGLAAAYADEHKDRIGSHLADALSGAGALIDVAQKALGAK